MSAQWDHIFQTFLQNCCLAVTGDLLSFTRTSYFSLGIGEGSNITFFSCTKGLMQAYEGFGTYHLNVLGRITAGPLLGVTIRSVLSPLSQTEQLILI